MTKTKELTKQDLINFLEKNNYHTKKEVTITKEIAESWNLHDLCCFVACDSLQFRDVKGAIENANIWMEEGKDAIIKQWFGKTNIYNL